jgi:putative tricarboxylic transport membrane protein
MTATANGGTRASWVTKRLAVLPRHRAQFCHAPHHTRRYATHAASGGDMKTLKPEFWLAICVIIGASIYLYADYQMPVSRMGDALGPRAFPALVGCGLLLAGVLLLFEAFGKKNAVKSIPTAEPETGAPLTNKERIRQSITLVAMVAWTALYYTVFEQVGYLVSTVVFLGALLSYFHRGHYRTNALTAVGFALVVDLVFTHLLNVPLPAGILSI